MDPRRLAFAWGMPCFLLVLGGPARALDSAAIVSECGDLLEDELDELEARARSAYLIRGRSMPVFSLRCDAERLELGELAPAVATVTRSRDETRLVEQFVSLLGELLQKTPGPDVSSSPGAIPDGERTVGALAAPAASGQDAGKQEATREEPEEGPESAESAESEESERRDGPDLAASPRRVPPRADRLSLAPSFTLWATELAGAFGLDLAWRQKGTRIGAVVRGSGQVSVDERSGLRPFEVSVGGGIWYRPLANLSFELSPVLSFVAVPPPSSTDAAFGSSLRPGLLLGASVEFPSSFGAWFGALGVRATLAERAIFVGDERLATIPAVAPWMSLGVELDL